MQKLDYLQSSLVASAVTFLRQLLVDALASFGEAAAMAARQTAKAVGEHEAGEAAVEAVEATTAATVEVAGPPVEEEVALLERTSLADALSGLSPISLLPTILRASRLSEPTFAELVVAWRRPPPASAARRLQTTARMGALSLPAVFRAVDANGDGRLSWSELTRALQSPGRVRRAARRAAALARRRVGLPPPPPTVELRLFREIPISTFSLVLPFSRPSFSLSDWLRCVRARPDRQFPRGTRCGPPSVSCTSTRP